MKKDDKEYRTIQFLIKEGNPLHTYLGDMMYLSNNLFNATNFYIRQAYTGLKLEKTQRHDLQNEVIELKYYGKDVILKLSKKVEKMMGENMSTSKETIFSEACKKGDLDTLKILMQSNMKLTSKTRKKGLNNLFKRGLFEAKNTKKELEVITLLCSWVQDVTLVIKEEDVIEYLTKEKFNIVTQFLVHGYSLDRKSDNPKFKTLYDRMIRESLGCYRIKAILYLIDIFNLELVDKEAIRRIIEHDTDMISYIELKIKEEKEYFTSFIELLDGEELAYE